MIAALLTIHLLSGLAPEGAKELETPGVDYRVATAGATAAPWVTANGWQFLRNPEAKFVSHAAGAVLPLAMIEAFAWHGNVWFSVADADKAAFDDTLAFLQAVPSFKGKLRAQVGVEDDGTEQAGEALKLLVRRNLMAGPSRGRAELVVKPETANPAAFAASVRKRLGDDHRLLRLYGSDVVLAALEGDAEHTRVHLVNYSNRDVHGARIRVLGKFSDAKIFAIGQPELALKDFAFSDGGTEFTVPILTRYAVIDVVR